MKKKIKWHLQLLAEAAAGEGTTGDSAQAEGAADLQAGTGTDTAATENPTKTPDEEFEELINGQYKDSFHKRTQKIINSRFKETENLKAIVEQNREINEALAAKYGIDVKDTKALAKAVSSDDSYYEQKAYEEGLTIEQYKEKLAGQRAQQRLAEIERAERRRQLSAAIDKQQNQIRETYGDTSFDFWAEYNTNGEFKGMVDSGVPMETAYKVINHEKFVANVQKQAAAQASKAVTNNIIANGRRPVEGGMKKQPAVSSSFDVNSIKSLKDIEKIYEMHGKGK